jgi:hypothetical protein
MPKGGTSNDEERPCIKKSSDKGTKAAKGAVAKGNTNSSKMM